MTPSRQGGPVFWFAVGLPAVVVVAGFVTLFLAVRGRDEVVRDDYRREGLAIYVDPARDAAARDAGAQARLQFREDGRLHIDLTLARGSRPGSLLLILSHATRAEFDRMLTAERQGDSYFADHATLPPGHWYLELTPPDRSWRLRGELRQTPSVVELNALAGH